MPLFCCEGAVRAPAQTIAHAPPPPNLEGQAKFTPLPQLHNWDALGGAEREAAQAKVESIVANFAKEFIKGKVLMKLGRNGRLFYRLCTLDKDLTSFSMHVKGHIVEFPFANMQQIRFGYNLTDFTHVPVSLPSDALAAVLGMENEPLNLIFSSPVERDEFVTCMMVLKERHRRAEGYN